MKPPTAILLAFLVLLWGIEAFLLSASPAFSATPAAAASRSAMARVAASGAAREASACSDTNEVDAEWVELAPPVRRSHSAVFDPANDRMLVFGGDQMWALGLGEGGRWSRVDPSGIPPRGGLAVLDPARQRMLVGSDSSLWSLPLDAEPEWSALPTSGSPSPYLALLHDPGRDRLLALSDRLEVWQLPVSGPLVWTPLATSGAPAGPRTGFSAVYDSPRDRVLVYGGHVPRSPPCDEHLVAVNEVWALPLGVGSVWQQLPVPSGPATGGHTAIYDHVRDRMVIFGGHDWSLPGCAIGNPDCNWDCYSAPSFREVGCWALSLSPESAWTPIDIGGEPADRAGHSAIYDPVRDRMVVYGGQYSSGECPWAEPADFSDATALVFGAQQTWQPVATGTPRNHVVGSRAVYEPSRNRMILYGGYRYSPCWGGYTIGGRASYDLRTEEPTIETYWQGPSRHSTSIVVDPIRNRLVLFGGFEVPYVGTPGQPVNDTWVADPGGGTPWEELMAAGIPPAPRWEHTAVFDPIGDQMFVYGGRVFLDGYSSPEPDRSLWSLPFGQATGWTELFSASPFASRGYPTVVLDPDCRRLVFFGDLGAGDVWTLPLDPGGVWARLLPSGPGPDPGVAIEAIFDSGRHRVVVNRQWELSLGPTPAWTRLRIHGTGPTQGATVHDPVGDRLVVCTDETSSFWALRFRPAAPAAVGSPRPLAAGLQLSRPSPNPTRGHCRFVLELAKPASISLGVFDTQGRRVATVKQGLFGAGSHVLSWDRSAAGGGHVAAGLYFLRATSSTATSVRRLLVLP